MTECPSPECHRNLEGVRKTLYGPDGKSGVAACVQRKVSWKQMGAIASLLIMIIIAANYRIMDAAEKALRERAENKQQIEVIHKDLEHIKMTSQELKNGQNKIKEEVQELKIKQMTPELFKEIIKDAIKENPK